MRHRQISALSRWSPVRSICFLLAIFFFASGHAIACLNPIGRNEVGTRIQPDGISAQEFVSKLLGHEDRKYWTETLKELQRRQKNIPFIVDPNNIAVAMVHLGQIQQAIEILERHEKAKPGVYQTAANLGTAYELNGQNEKALEWIAEGVRRNREGHFGTEWLHVKILKAKIALENSSEWLNSNSILGIEFPADSRPESDLSISDDFGIKRNLPAIESALIYQLHERLEFVKPQEPVVADLLYDLSRIFKLTRSPEHSAAIKELAGQYGPGHERKSLNTNDANASRTLTPPFRKYLFLGGLGVIGILLALGVLRFVFMGRGR